MSEADDQEQAALIEQALSEHQRLEREEADADLKRQLQIDDAIVRSLSTDDDGTQAGT
jgi:hypothetical protein